MKPWMIFSTVKRSSLLGGYFWLRLKMAILFSSIFLFSVIIGSDIKLQEKSRSLLLDSTGFVTSLCQSPIRFYTTLTSFIKSHSQVYTQNEKLKHENEVLKKYYHHSLAVEAENQRLRTKFRIIDDLEPEFMSVRVIGDIDSLYQKHIFLAGGKKVGIYPKKAVLMDRHIVGRIIEVGQYSSRVLRTTDAHSHIPVVLEKSQIHGIASGDNTRFMKIKIVEKDLLSVASPGSGMNPESIQEPKVSKGEYVFSSGHGGIFPPGFIIGRVVNITSHEILVESMIENHPLDYVQVAKSFKEPL